MLRAVDLLALRAAGFLTAYLLVDFFVVVFFAVVFLAVDFLLADFFAVVFFEDFLAGLRVRFLPSEADAASMPFS